MPRRTGRTYLSALSGGSVHGQHADGDPRLLLKRMPDSHMLSLNLSPPSGKGAVICVPIPMQRSSEIKRPATPQRDGCFGMRSSPEFAEGRMPTSPELAANATTPTRGRQTWPAHVEAGACGVLVQTSGSWHSPTLKPGTPAGWSLNYKGRAMSPPRSAPRQPTNAILPPELVRPRTPTPEIRPFAAGLSGQRLADGTRGRAVKQRPGDSSSPVMPAGGGSQADLVRSSHRGAN